MYLIGSIPFVLWRPSVGRRSSPRRTGTAVLDILAEIPPDRSVAPSSASLDPPPRAPERRRRRTRRFIPMSRESDWHVFDKAVEMTASAVRGTAGPDLRPDYVGELFTAIHEALTRSANSMPSVEAKTGF